MLKRTTLCFIAIMAIIGQVSAQKPAAPAPAADNPLLKEWTTPFGVPPFQEIKPEHFLPAYKQAIAENRKEIDAIATSSKSPTFANTLEAMENAGELLAKVGAVFSNLQSAETTPTLQKINSEVSPLLTALRDDIRLNPKLFARVKTLYDRRAKLKLTPIQAKLLEESYKGFVRGGANLNPAQKERFRAINTELAKLSIKFGDNLLAETNGFRLVIDKPEDLAGLPPSIVAAGADGAKAAKMPGKWVYTLAAPSIWPFLQYSDNRDLRAKILNAYTTRGDHGGEFDNKAIIAQIAALRAERANLLGTRPTRTSCSKKIWRRRPTRCTRC